jgi:hypothetical protein
MALNCRWRRGFAAEFAVSLPGAQSSRVFSMLLLMLLLLSVPCINETEHCAIAMHIAGGHKQVS